MHLRLGLVAALLAILAFIPAASAADRADLDRAWSLSEAPLQDAGANDDAFAEALSLLEAVVLDGDAALRARALFRMAQIEEALHRPASAARHYRESRVADPGGYFAMRAGSRAEWLDERLARDPDGDFHRDLDRLMADYERNGSDRSLALAEALLARTTRPTLLADVELWLAAEYRFKRLDWEPALRWALQAAERDGVRRFVRHQALKIAIDAAEHTGDLAMLRKRLERMIAAEQDPRIRDDLDRLRDDTIDRQQRAWARVFSWTSLASLAAIFLATGAWRNLRGTTLGGVRASRVAFLVVWIFGVAGLISGSFEHGRWLEFALALPAVALIFLASLAIGATLDARRAPTAWRVGAALASIGSVFGAIFLLLTTIRSENVLGM